MDRLTNTEIPDGMLESEQEMRAGLSDRRDIIDRDVVCYYQDPNDSNVWLESKLKVGDDVLLFQGTLKARVVGAAEGRENFVAIYYSQELGLGVGAYRLVDVEDRNPLDQNEAQPWFPLILQGVNP